MLLSSRRGAIVFNFINSVKGYVIVGCVCLARRRCLDRYNMICEASWWVDVKINSFYVECTPWRHSRLYGSHSGADMKGS